MNITIIEKIPTKSIILVLVLLILVVGCETQTVEEDKVINPDLPRISLPSDAPKSVVLEPIILTGTGNGVTDFFHLESGIAIFNIETDGQDYVTMWLTNENGEMIDKLVTAKGVRLINSVTKYKGSKALGVEKSEYLIDVSGDGNWKITIEQPRPTTAPATKIFSGKRGDITTTFFYLDYGQATITATHLGEKSNFIVWLLDKDGQPIELVFNEIGIYNGTKDLGVYSGIYILNVMAGGDWNIQIEQ